MSVHRSSFGVECEFMVCIQDEHTNVATPELFALSPGRPIMVPPLTSEHDIIKQMIDEVTKTFKGSRVCDTFNPAKDPEAHHLINTREWSVVEDTSLSMPQEILQQEHMNSYTWTSVEVKSPALWVEEDSFEEIRRVINAIRENYWVYLPRSAGFHVHYGVGKHYIPLPHLRRIAALTFAADPILTQLHPPHRRANDFCRSNRLYSRLAHGRDGDPIASNTSQRIGAGEVEYPPEPPDYTTNAAAPRKARRRPRTHRAPGFQCVFKRGTLDGYTFSAAHYRATRNAALGDAPDEPLPLLSGVAQLLGCANAATLAELMSWTNGVSDRPAYHFGAAHRTVEFRQMAATLDPDVVAAHAAVAARLCDWAAAADLPALWNVVLDCRAGAETDPALFDVFDLLPDLGLVREAHVLQRDVARWKGVAVPELVDTSCDHHHSGWLARLSAFPLSWNAAWKAITCRA
ncbi:putative amidoligase enzyme-domain-containing protein [Biscogniauxia sp. FL1348]|nr:putative amidoligase enzyme-domain-containing protein [Biscogniauxia sp. FL1348]